MADKDKELLPEQAARVKVALERLEKGDRYASRTELAKAIGMSRPGLVQLLSGKNSAGFRTAQKVAEVTGMSVADLLGPPLPDEKLRTIDRPRPR